MIIHGNNIDALKLFPDNHFDSIVTDPPYGLGKEPNAEQLMKDWIDKGFHEIKGGGFMGKEWDAFVPQPIFWKEVFRVLKHGGYVVSFFGTRTYDWGVMSMRFAGFEVRDCIQWLYGSGFPKSHNISKAIDKMYGAEREIIGEKIRGDVQKAKEKGSGYLSDPANKNNQKQFGYGIELITKASTEQAKQWDGWGTALKPANEPIVLARKPLEKGLTVAENVLKWGVGAINIDDCRINFKNEADYKESTEKNQHENFGTKPMTNNNIYGDYSMVQPKNYKPEGRFPANIILGCYCENENNHNEDCPIRVIDEQSGETKSKKSERGNIVDNNIFGKYNLQDNTIRGHNDMGGASRFFYVAKASKSEREKGLSDFEIKKENLQGLDTRGRTLLREDGTKTLASNFTPSERANNHPTVKPIKLMQYLVKLVTPPNGIVLDPFCGSGTTGIACKIDGFQFVGIDQDLDYCKIAEARIENTISVKQTKLF
jgi:site-specific DNA-methyltransferase (adenine-specific)